MGTEYSVSTASSGHVLLSMLIMAAAIVFLSYRVGHPVDHDADDYNGATNDMIKRDYNREYRGNVLKMHDNGNVEFREESSGKVWILSQPYTIHLGKSVEEGGARFEYHTP